MIKNKPGWHARLAKMAQPLVEAFRRRPLPRPIVNVCLMLRWSCRIHLLADIRYPHRCRFGRGSRLDRCTVIANGPGPFSVDLGKVEIRDGAILDALGGSIRIGDETTINYYCVLYGAGGLSIGKECGVAAHTVMVAAAHTYSDPTLPMMRQPISLEGIVVADDVWLGAGCRLLDGVRLERGTIVGAGAVVTCGFPPGSVVVGVPARLLKKRIGYE
jgi:acetyltransferase-like isoleucine patch superfamily enzyme